MFFKMCRFDKDLKPVLQDLGSAIASTQVMTAQQVVRAENGDEVRFYDPLHKLFITLDTAAVIT